MMQITTPVLEELALEAGTLPQVGKRWTPLLDPSSTPLCSAPLPKNNSLANTRNTA